MKVKSAKELLTRDGTHCICSKCKQEKLLNEENFHKAKTSPTGFKTVCKECKRKYYQENREAKKEYQLKYAQENKEYYSEYRKHYNREKGKAEGFNMKYFKKGIIPEVNYREKLISVDGEVTTKDGKIFTRLIGGFENNSPIFTIWQVAELLNLNTRDIVKNFNNYINRFQVTLDYIDLKTDVDNRNNEINLRDFYHINKLNKTKQWIIFSQSGLLKMLKISNTKESWDIYESFIEDYFKTKAELIVAENTIQENISTLEDTKKMLIGSLVMEMDEKKKIEIFMQLEKINNQLLANARTLAKEETINQFKDIITIADRFTDSANCYDIGVFSKILSIPNMGRNNMYKWLREEKILQSNNAPYQNMTDKFKVIMVENNGFKCTKTLLRGEGVKFIVNRLIKKGYINNMTTEEVLEKLKDMEEVA